MSNLFDWMLGVTLFLLIVASLLTIIMLLVVIRGELKTSQTVGSLDGIDLKEGKNE